MGYKLKKTIFAKQLASDLGLTIVGGDREIVFVSQSSIAKPGALAFSKSLDGIKPGVILILPESDENNILKQGVTGIVSSNPRLDFIRALSYLEEISGFSSYDFPSKIHPSVRLGKNVVIEDGCTLSENVVIEHNVTIHSGTRIGKNSRVRSNASIGGDGFGFERQAGGRPIRFEHLGGVIIGENVEIGSCACIARGTLGDTVIEDYVKIDNLVHVAHNCRICDGAFLIACSEVSGGVVVGENVWVAPNASITQKVKIGDNALVGLGSVVTKTVAPNKIVAGNPAKVIRDV